MNIPPRLITEIAMRYKLEPELNDIYVEGSTDKEIFDKSFSVLGMNRAVYKIDTVDIGWAVLKKHGLTEGNKQRVIALCLELALPDNSDVRFFVDKDMDHHLNKMIDYAGLVYSEFCDMECLFMDRDGIKSLVYDTGRIDCKDWDILVSSIERAAKSLFSLRIALAEFDYNKKLPDISKSLAKVEGAIVVDVCSIINKLILSQEGKEIVLGKYEEWLEKFADLDVRIASRGHDIFELLEWVVKKFNGIKGVGENLARLLILLAPQRARELIAPLML